MLHTIPNYLTLARLVSAVPLAILINEGFFMSALILFILVMPTDWLDGLLARRLNQETAIGGFLDAFSDKIFIYVILFSLYRFEALAYWVLMPLFARDILVDALRNFAARDTGPLPANWSGKTKFLLQNIVVILGLVYLQYNGSEKIAFYWAVNLVLLAAFIFSLPGLYYQVRALRGRK